MKTLKEYYYTYYSYEEWGRGYIGSRGCYCLPEEDVKYFGSFKDKTFRPTQKIILGIYETREEAIEAEIILHDFYDVANNPHFANRAKQTSTKFCVSIEQAIQRGKQFGEEYGKIGGKKSKELGVGIHGLTPEQTSENARKAGKIGGKKTKELGMGVHGRTKEQMVEDGRKGGKIGGKISGKKQKELGIGIHGRTKEQKIEDGRKGSEKTNTQKWMCLETKFVSTSGPLSRYQNKRGIDTSKRTRIQ